MIEIRHEKMDQISEIRKSYNQIYRGEGILHRDSLYEKIIDLLKAQPGSSLIDIACGEGRLVTLAKQRGLNAAGIDFSFEGIWKGRQATPNAFWLIGDGERLPLADHSFDYLTNVGSLEHFFSPQQGACEMARILKPSGRACVLVPNVFGIFGNISTVVRTGDVFDDGQPLQRYGTRQAWERILESAGLKVEKVTVYGEVMLRSWSDLAWLLRRPQKLIRLMLNHLVPVNLGNHFIFLCRAEEGAPG